MSVPFVMRMGIGRKIVLSCKRKIRASICLMRVSLSMGVTSDFDFWLVGHQTIAGFL